MAMDPKEVVEYISTTDKIIEDQKAQLFDLSKRAKEGKGFEADLEKICSLLDVDDAQEAFEKISDLVKAASEKRAVSSWGSAAKVEKKSQQTVGSSKADEFWQKRWGQKK